MKARQAELLAVAYYHVVFTVPAEVADIAYQNKAVAYDILFKAASQALLTIAADPRRLGARIGVTAVLHSWGSAMTHHPHLHCIVPGGGLSADGQSWISCRPRFFLPVRVLSRLFRRLLLDKLADAHLEGRLGFFGDLAGLADRSVFTARLAPLRRREWVVYAKRPFAGPEAVLAYLARYTPPGGDLFQSPGQPGRAGRHLRVEGLPRKWGGPAQAHDPGRRRVHPPLPHPRPAGRLPPHPSLWPVRQRRSIGPTSPRSAPCCNRRRRRPLRTTPSPPNRSRLERAPCCGGRMLFIETFERGVAPRTAPVRPVFRIDTS